MASKRKKVHLLETAKDKEEALLPFNGNHDPPRSPDTGVVMEDPKEEADQRLLGLYQRKPEEVPGVGLA